LSSNLAFNALFRFHFQPESNIVSVSKRIPQMKNKYSRAFTLVELLVVIATIGILAALAIPVFTGVIERAKATKDMSNLRQIGMAMQTLLNDNDQLLPVTTTWPGISTSTTPVLYPKYVGTRKVFQSPFDKRPSMENDSAPVSYSINTNMYIKLGTNPNMLKVASPSSTFLMAPVFTGSPATAASWMGTAGNSPDLPVGAPLETTGTHSSGTKINVLFCDWHTETLTFGPNGSPAVGSFKDTMTDPLGLKHWDPTK
jgi:prepilin-type N-terminal cleavage/methylation domain-containing protein/prepilin-type processing-associated H-X9-DG protein